MGEFWDELKQRVRGAETPLEGLAAFVHPQPPFDGRGSALVAFGSMVIVLVSFAAAVFSLAGLVVSLAAIYLICAKVFGIRVDLREDLPF